MSTDVFIEDTEDDEAPYRAKVRCEIAGYLSDIKELQAELQSVEAKLKAWRDAVIDQLVVTHIYSAAHDEDPRKAINDLLGWEAQLALDPQVSRGAAELVAKATSLLEAKLVYAVEVLKIAQRYLFNEFEPDNQSKAFHLITDAIGNVPERAQKLQEFIEAFSKLRCAPPLESLDDWINTVNKWRAYQEDSDG